VFLTVRVEKKRKEREEERRVLGLGTRKIEKSERRRGNAETVAVAESVAVSPRHRVRVEK
jgi:hypothetical protein